MRPVIALVGRANVGKSTLFNRLTKTRDAIVADFAGLTRDRHYGDASVGGHDFIVVDTGGFVPEHPTGIVRLMARQAEQAVAEADAVVFVVDLRAGVSAHDHDIARYLRSAGKRVVVAVNKAEGMADSALIAEFYELGLGDPHPISAAHGQGVVALAEAALAAAGVEEPVGDDEPETLHVRLMANAVTPAAQRVVSGMLRAGDERSISVKVLLNALTSAEGIGDWDAVQRNATELLGWIEDDARGERVTEEAT